MVDALRDIGIKIRGMGKGLSCFRKAITMRENIFKISRMERADTNGSQGNNILANGPMGYVMVKETGMELMVVFIKGNGKMGKCTE